MRVQPKLSRMDGWINAGFIPPATFVAATVQFAVVPAAKRDRKLIARLASQGYGLHDPQVMGVGRPAAADQTRLLGDIFDVISIPDPAWLRMHQNTLVDPDRPRPRSGGFFLPIERLIGRFAVGSASQFQIVVMFKT